MVKKQVHQEKEALRIGGGLFQRILGANHAEEMKEINRC
jgi:hypothetical protein